MLTIEKLYTKTDFNYDAVDSSIVSDFEKYEKLVCYLLSGASLQLFEKFLYVNEQLNGEIKKCHYEQGVKDGFNLALELLLKK